MLQRMFPFEWIKIRSKIDCLCYFCKRWSKTFCLILLAWNSINNNIAINANQIVNPNLSPRSSWTEISLHEVSKSTTEPFYSQINRPELISKLRFVPFHIEFRVVWLLPHSIITLTNTTFPSNSIMVSRSIVAIKHALTSELHLSAHQILVGCSTGTRPN